MTKKQTRGADWNNITVSDIYVKDIKTKTDEMNDGQIRELIRVVQKCDKNKLNEEALGARNKVIEATLAHIERRARKYRNLDLSVGDLINEAAEKLLSKAIWKYDTERKCKFFTYADWYIVDAFSTAIENDKPIRIPEKKMAELKKILKAKMKLEEVCSNPTVEMIAGETGIDEAIVIRYLSLNPDGVSMEEGLSEDGEMTVGDVVASDAAYPVSSYERKDLLEQMEILLSSLPEQERKIIEWRFPKDGEKKKTHKEIGKILGISDEAVRQKEQKILRQKLLSKASKMGLADYLYESDF